MAVEESLRVEFQQFRVDLAVQDENLLLAVEAGHAGAVEGRTARVDDERHHLASRPQILQRHHGILAASDGNNHGISVLRHRVGELRHRSSLFGECKVHELQVVGFDAVLVHEFAQSVPVELAPPPLLVLVQRIGLHQDGRAAGALPVADQLNHADMEDNALQLFEVEAVPVGRMLPGGKHHLRGELDLLTY